MMRGRADGAQKKRLFTYVGIVTIILVFLYVYFGSNGSGESALEYGSRSLKRLGTTYLGGDEDGDLGGKHDDSSKFGLDDGEDGITPKTFPVSVYNFKRIYNNPWVFFVSRCNLEIAKK